MRNISTKTDNVGDVLPASDFNVNHRAELQNVVLSAGFSLDPEGGPDTDTEMLGKSIAIYSVAGSYYEDTGAADAYEVDRVGTLYPIESYIDGLTVTFKAANANTGASTLDVDGVGAKDLVDNTGAALVAGAIVSNGYVTARYNSSTDDFEVIATGGRSLSTWENVGDDFRPVVSGTGTLGTSTNFVEALYLGDNHHIYLGAAQDCDFYHTGTLTRLLNNTGALNIGTTSTTGLFFLTNNTTRWYINTTGDLLPTTANTYNLGSSSEEIKNIYQGDSAHHYLGNDQDIDIVHDGSNSYFTNNTGNLNIYEAASASVVIWSNATARWSIDSNGDLLPFANNSYDIGSATLGVSSIYLDNINISGENITSDGDLILSSTAGATNYVRLRNGTTSIFLVNSGGMLPGTTATYDIGSGSLEIDNLYCVTLIESSDANDKVDFEDSLGLDFILDLNPCSYKMVKGKNKNRKHGLVAQEVLGTIERLGKTVNDFSAINYDEESGIYGLSYSQFIAPIIKSIQEINDKIESLIGTL